MDFCAAHLPRFTRVVIGALLCVLASACAPGDRFIAVDLRTDLRPGEEFDRVEVSLRAQDDGSGRDLAERIASPLSVSAGAPTLAGMRIAEFSGLVEGAWIVRAELFLAGREVDSAFVVVELGGQSQGATIRITRDCAHIRCPDGDEPQNTVCLGGQCVDPRCSLETPEFCPVEECTRDDQCVLSPDLPACASAVCLAGVCGVWLDTERLLSGAPCCDEGQALVGDQCVSIGSCADNPCNAGVECTDDASAPTGYTCGDLSSLSARYRGRRH